MPIKKKSQKVKRKKMKAKKRYIKYDWDGGDIAKMKAEPNSDFSYISPNNSPGIFKQNFSECNLENSDLSYSIFFKCNFRKTNMLNVEIKESIFPQSDFRGAINLSSQQKKNLKKTGAILTDTDLKKLNKYLQHRKNIYIDNEKLKKIIKKNTNKLNKFSKWEINY